FLAFDPREDRRGRTLEARVRIASAIELEWLEELFPMAIRREREVVFDEARGRAVARNRLLYRDLVLREDTHGAVEPEEASAALARALSRRASEFVREDEAAASWLTRLECLRDWIPEAGLPAFTENDLTEILANACKSKRTVEEVRKVPLLPLLKSRLSHSQVRLLDEQAPEAITVPSGSRIRLQYERGRPPVLAVRLQELFGWTDTPRVAGGRVPVVLHLLGPNFRPVQITEDLRSFWTTTYFQVRKDLRARYPRHSWPEDPWTARPEAKGGRGRG
ncbi:MAG: ATP-dependent helicase HrpB, partial [Isosphaeraceae bacterium]|nr:ATP-dependent helicase HrpB [Isosphaeraceae bacterium]